jgi:hypothetical protein
MTLNNDQIEIITDNPNMPLKELARMAGCNIHDISNFRYAQKKEKPKEGYFDVHAESNWLIDYGVTPRREISRGSAKLGRL